MTAVLPGLTQLDIAFAYQAVGGREAQLTELENQFRREQAKLNRFLTKELISLMGGGKEARQAVFAVWLAMTQTGHRPGYVDSMALLAKHRKHQEAWEKNKILPVEDALGAFIKARLEEALFPQQDETTKRKHLLVALTAAQCLAESNH